MLSLAQDVIGRLPGDLPPRSKCAPAWRAALLAHLDQLQLTIVLGRYAQAYHFPAAAD